MSLEIVDFAKANNIFVSVLFRNAVLEKRR